MKKLLIIMALLFSALTVDARNFKNTNAVWVWSSYMNQVDLQEMKDKNIGNIILHEVSFKNHGEDSTVAFIKAAKKKGIMVHIWFQCFYSGGKWISPVDDEHNCYKLDYYDEVITRAEHYLDLGVEAIHLDYIRFGGTAHKHNPSAEITATGAVTEFCRQISTRLRAKNRNVVLSAALMPEPDSEYYYGQDPAQMGKYLDILMPMIYRHSPSYTKGGYYWGAKVAAHFAEKGKPAQVWAGTTTYNGDDGNVKPMNAKDIMVDCRTFIGTGAKGVVFFRFGLGEIPDMTGFML